MPPNPQNLQPASTKDEARRRGRLGGLRSGESRRRIKTMGEMFRAFLKQKSEKDPSRTNYEVMIQSAIDKALIGDIKAAEFIRDTIGEKPSTMVDLKGTLAQAVRVDFSAWSPEQIDELVDKAFNTGARKC